MEEAGCAQLKKMKTANKLIILFILILVACHQDKLYLPKSFYYVNLPKTGIDRNIFLYFRNGHLYHNDSLVNDLDHFYNNLNDFVKMNEGSNRYRIVFSTTNNTNFKLVDSIFYQLAKNGFNKCFILTNEPIDSVGFHIPMLLEAFPDLWNHKGYDSIKNSRNNKIMISINAKKIYINDSIINPKTFKNQCYKIIKADQDYCLQMKENNFYGDFVYLLDEYLLAYKQLINEYCVNQYNKPYDSLKLNDKEKVNYKFVKRWNFKYEKNSVHNIL